MKWARLTRKRQDLTKQLNSEQAENEKSVQKTISMIQKILRAGIFILYRSTAVVTLDENMTPHWLVKMAGFCGFGFIRFGDVSCFMWFFW